MLRTHMPFIAPMPDGTEALFFCRAGDDLLWKLHYFNESGKAVRINTGLPDDTTECSPTAWYDDSGWHISFIGGGAKENRQFYLYRMDGATLETLCQPVRIELTRAGFIFQDQVVWSEHEESIHIRHRGDVQLLTIKNSFIYRVSYRPDKPELLLVSGEWYGDRFGIFSLQINVNSGEQEYLEADNQPAYKCAINGERIIFARIGGGQFEDRRLKTCRKMKRTNTKDAQLLKTDLLPQKRRCGKCKSAPKGGYDVEVDY